jgi:hypothetical protein
MKPAKTMRFTAFTSILRCTFAAYVAYVAYVGCGEARTASIAESKQTFLNFAAISGIFSLENTLQASVTVRCRIAQTGGFVFLRGNIRNKNPKRSVIPFVGCGEARTASAFESMRFTMFTASYGLREMHS